MQPMTQALEEKLGNPDELFEIERLIFFEKPTVVMPLKEKEIEGDVRDKRPNGLWAGFFLPGPKTSTANLRRVTEDNHT